MNTTLLSRTRKSFTYGLFAAALLSCVVSIMSLKSHAAPGSTCGQACIAPSLRCSGGCFCDLTLGNGIDSGVCVAR